MVKAAREISLQAEAETLRPHTLDAAASHALGEAHASDAIVGGGEGAPVAAYRTVRADGVHGAADADDGEDAGEEGAADEDADNVPASEFMALQEAYEGLLRRYISERDGNAGAHGDEGGASSDVAQSTAESDSPFAWMGRAWQPASAGSDALGDRALHSLTENDAATTDATTDGASDVFAREVAENWAVWSTWLSEHFAQQWTPQWAQDDANNELWPKPDGRWCQPWDQQAFIDRPPTPPHEMGRICSDDFLHAVGSDDEASRPPAPGRGANDFFKSLERVQPPPAQAASLEQQPPSAPAGEDTA